MTAKFETNLVVNGTTIDLNEFAHEFITRIVICAVSMLKGGEDVNSLLFTLENHKPRLAVNEEIVPLSPFPRDALVSTITGMVSSLKGVKQVENLKINIKAV